MFIADGEEPFCRAGDRHPTSLRSTSPGLRPPAVRSLLAGALGEARSSPRGRRSLFEGFQAHEASGSITRNQWAQWGGDRLPPSQMPFRRRRRNPPARGGEHLDHLAYRSPWSRLLLADAAQRGQGGVAGGEVRQDLRCRLRAPARPMTMPARGVLPRGVVFDRAALGIEVAQSTGRGNPRRGEADGERVGAQHVLHAESWRDGGRALGPVMPDHPALGPSTPSSRRAVWGGVAHRVHREADSSPSRGHLHGLRAGHHAHAVDRVETAVVASPSGRRFGGVLEPPRGGRCRWLKRCAGALDARAGALDSTPRRWRRPPPARP